MKNLSTSIQRRKRGKRTEYIARLTYYDKTGKRKGVSKSSATHWDTKRELQDLIDEHVAGGSEVLEARNMTFAALAKHCKETRYCEAFYDEQGRKLYGVREPKKFASIINRLVVAQIVADFVKNYDPKKERCWIAEKDGEKIGCVFLVKESNKVAEIAITHRRSEGARFGSRNTIG